MAAGEPKGGGAMIWFEELRLGGALLLIELVVCILPDGHPALLQLGSAARSLAR